MAWSPQLCQVLTGVACIVFGNFLVCGACWLEILESVLKQTEPLLGLRLDACVLPCSKKSLLMDLMLPGFEFLTKSYPFDREGARLCRK